MTEDVKRLRSLKLKRVSLVDDPANEHAAVVLFKSADGKPAAKAKKDDDTGAGDMVACSNCGAKMGKGSVRCSKCGTSMKKEANMKVDLDKITDPDVRKAVEKMAGDLEAAVALAQTEQDKRVAAEAATKKAGDEADLLKGLPEAVRHRIEKAETEAKAANDAVKKMAEEKREGEFIAKAKGYGNLSVDPKKFGPVLKRISDGTSTEEDVAEIHRVLVGANNVAKTALFAQRGSSERGTGGASTAWAEIQVKANEKRAEVMKAGTKMTYPEALDAIIKEHPELYQRHLQDFSQQVKAAGAGGAMAEEE